MKPFIFPETTNENWIAYPDNIPEPNYESSWGFFSKVFAAQPNGARVSCSFDPMAGYFVDRDGDDIGDVIAFKYDTPPIVYRA